MQADKRRWIYEGMAVPPGVALGERKVVREASSHPRSVVLIGAEFAGAVGPALARLLSDHGIALHVEARPKTTVVAWATERWLSDVLSRHRADLVVVALEPTEPGPLVDTIRERCRAGGARVLWLAVPEGPMAKAAGPTDIAATTGPSATDLAALAAVAFRGMRLDHHHGATHG